MIQFTNYIMKINILRIYKILLKKKIVKASLLTPRHIRDQTDHKRIKNSALKRITL